MVAIHFTDNGSGMSEDTMKKVFNYGYTTSRPAKVRDLVYICVNILSIAWRDYQSKDKLGEGTTFTVTLPIIRKNRRRQVQANRSREIIRNHQ